MNSKKQAPECEHTVMVTEVEPRRRYCYQCRKTEEEIKKEKPKRKQEHNTVEPTADNSECRGSKRMPDTGSNPASGADREERNPCVCCGQMRPLDMLDGNQLCRLCSDNGRTEAKCKKCGKDYQIYGQDGVCDDCAFPVKEIPAPQPSVLTKDEVRKIIDDCWHDELGCADTKDIIRHAEQAVLAKCNNKTIQEYANLLKEVNESRKEMDALKNKYENTASCYDSYRRMTEKEIKEKDNRIRELERLKPNPAHVLVLLNTAERLMTLQEIKEQLGLSERDAHVFTDTLMDARLIDAKYEVVNGKQTYRFFSKEGILLENAKEKARVEK